MKKTLLLLAVLVSLIAGWVIASPYWVLYQLKQAYEVKDTATINRYVYYPHVRQDIKAQLSPILITKAQQVTQSPILQALGLEMNGTAMVQKLVNQAVDNTITPEGVTQLVTEQLPPDKNALLLAGLTVVAMGKLNFIDLMMAENKTELQQKIHHQLMTANSDSNASKPQARYCGFNCFSITGEVRGYPLTVTLARQGLINWHIVGVKLPLGQ